MNNQSSRGTWQIKLRGNNKVRRVVVVVRTRNDRGPGRPITIQCSSWDHAYAQCDTGKQITSIQVQQQHSSSSGACIRGKSFGVYGRYIWVSQGCRATFRVTAGGHVATN